MCGNWKKQKSPVATIKICCVRLALPKNRYEDLRLAIRSKELEVIHKNMYLDVVIINPLNWKEHFRIASARVSKTIGFLRLKTHTLVL